ncbi:hypothetical protein [Thiolapillus sp.]|nr:hypothetical protein [Thiolapillus sp.]
MMENTVIGDLLVLGFSSFATVFLLVFQQQNVIHKKYLWAALTSAGITLSQVLVIRGVASSTSPSEIVALTIGGVTGVLLSMFLHSRIMGWFGRGKEACGERR